MGGTDSLASVGLLTHQLTGMSNSMTDELKQMCVELGAIELALARTFSLKEYHELMRQSNELAHKIQQYEDGLDE